MAPGTAARRRASDVGEVEPAFNPLDASVEPVQAIGKVRVLTLEDAETALHLAHVVAQAVDRSPDVTQMLKHEVFSLGYATNLPENSC